MSSNSSANSPNLSAIESDDGSIDLNSKKTWETINNHMLQINLLWGEDASSPLSTSPANHNINSPVVTRPHSNQYNPLYRRSEGDILGTTLNPPSSNNPPQSAPVLPEGYELKWESNNKKSSIGILKDVGSRLVIPEKLSNVHEVEETNLAFPYVTTDKPTSMFKNTDNVSEMTSHAKINHGKDNHLHLQADSPSTILYTSNSLKMRSPSSGTQPYPIYKPPDSHSPVYPLHHQTSSPLLQTHKSSPSSRRKSAPITATNMRSTDTRTMLPQRTIAQHPGIISNYFTTFPEKELTTRMPTGLDEEQQAVKADVNNDKEYTRALLQHQRDRMIRLQKEINMKKNELKLLYEDVQGMEMQVAQRNSTNKPPALPTLQHDVSKLREMNRQLKIECNCMFKEVELFSRDGDSTSDDFYSRYNRPQSLKTKPKKDGHMKTMFPRTDLPPPPAPPPSDPGDEPKWRCSYCTFDNHAALNKCEICDFSRGLSPGRH